MATISGMTERQKPLYKRILRDFYINRWVYILSIPMLLFYILFRYLPMYGVIIAFKEYAPGLGYWGSPWVGFRHFIDFFRNVYFFRVIRNTLAISLLSLAFAFPAPLILALLLNELSSKWFKRTVQTISYLPHFISIMVVAGLIVDFTASDGVISDLLEFMGMERQTMLLNPKLFRPIYIISDIWQSAGWGTIIYLSALTGIDPELYEAATIDGAGRFKRVIHVTLPGIMPTVIILLILRIGSIMNVGYEKIILLYNPNTYEVADVISSYVYRRGLQEFQYSFSTAVGLFNSIINFILVCGANYVSNKVSEYSLW